jgi:hypothetical protein
MSAVVQAESIDLRKAWIIFSILENQNEVRENLVQVVACQRILGSGFEVDQKATCDQITTGAHGHSWIVVACLHSPPIAKEHRCFVYQLIERNNRQQVDQVSNVGLIDDCESRVEVTSEKGPVQFG